MIVFNIDYMW